VLLSLADHAGADGGDAWPSVARLADRTNLSPRAVRRGLRELEDLEEIETTFLSGVSNRYRMTFHSRGQIDPPAKSTPAKSTGEGGQNRRGTPAKSTPKPKEEPSMKRGGRSSVDDETERRVAKRRAQGESIGSGLVACIRRDVEREFAARAALQEDEQRRDDCDICENGWDLRSGRAVRCAHDDEARAS